MSLLMDALKKAERDKKEAAKRLKEAQEQLEEQILDDRTLTQELSTEDGSVDPSAESVVPEETRDKLDDTAEIVDDLSLSPVKDKLLVLDDSLAQDQSVEESSIPVSPLPESPPFNDEDDKLSSTDNIELETSEVSEPEKPSNLDQTYALTDFQIEESADVPITIAEDTIQAEQASASETLAEVDEYEYFSATVSVAQLAEDIGSDSPTPVAAQTVFTASSSRPGNQMVQWSIFGALCLAIAVAISFIVFNFTVPIERSVKSPLVAKDVETQVYPAPVIEIPEELVSNTGLDSSLFTGEITDVIEQQNETVLDEELSNTEIESITDNVSADQEMITESVMVQETPEQEKIWYPAEDDSSITEIVEETIAVLPEKIMLEPKLIQISRSTSIDKRSVLINKAYQEYLEGDYDSASKGYTSVLTELPENRDALLGLAAISIRKGDIRQAYSNYLEVLRLYPGDSVAEAALINFKGKGDYSRNESLLKLFLQRETENSFLYYSLGRLYAVQTRWPEAQQSFFNAYRIESSNPDYAFNLAVSLDHIGQLQSAIDYYTVALDLAGQITVGSATSSFDRAAAISRINALSSPVDSQ